MSSLQVSLIWQRLCREVKGLTLSIVMTRKKAFVDGVHQDQTAQTVQSNL